ncbi:toll/interleukin-1 receptor domain-containing protein [Allorhizobium ampelinum]|uniref:toll/interleukin-1 receptor domain-containing protein n=1 Tax=Allorhizobium ampelinum TaxID=3025782 RepID=UPI001F1E83E3|nr:toll/interleukin-1 receptor domain-containing protein [Allorhizobium ampelinum]
MMADQVPTIDEIDSREKLDAYFRSRSLIEAQMVAFRASVRTVPFVLPIKSKGNFQRKKQLVSSIFRSMVVCRVSLRNPDDISSEVVDSARASVFSDASILRSASSRFSALSIGWSTGSLENGIGSIIGPRQDNFSSAARAVDLSISASIGVRGNFIRERKNPIAQALWNFIRDDLKFLFYNSSDELFSESIWWGKGIPYEVSHVSDFYPKLKELGEDWICVWDLYDSLSRGGFSYGSSNWETEKQIVSIAFENNAFWDRDPDVVMGEIALRLGATQKEQISEGVSFPISSVGRSDFSKKIDFFVSYSTKNEAYAREINSFLEEAGYSTIAQFKDFPVGSNFVIEMQEGLDRGARAIALLSPDYVASDHCRAEWAAIYAMDPIGKRRKLVSFLLEPTELNKLQRQIVYGSLIGLKQDARRKAVLDAVRHVVEVVTPDQLKQKLADIVSPDVAVTADGKIDVTPNAKYDLAVNSPDLPDLPTSLRGLCTIIIESLPENSPKTIAPTLRGYRGHLEERGAKPAIGFLGMLVAALTKEFESADFEFWGGGVNEHFESFFACHSKFLGHFPRSGEREQTYAEAEINEDEASGDDLIQPVQSVADAVEELKTIGKVTPGLERVVQGQVQIAKDVSSLPPNLSEDAGKGNVITPKRRFVLSQLGFWERMLAAVGSMTTLATTPQGQAAIAALREAIAKFLSLIL